MASVSLEALQTILDRDFGGKLARGFKEPGKGECCGMQLLSVAKGLPWTDEPEQLGSWAMSPINDIEVTPQVRAQYLLPVLAAYSDALAWPAHRQRTVLRRLFRRAEALVGETDFAGWWRAQIVGPFSASSNEAVDPVASSAMAGMLLARVAGAKVVPKSSGLRPFFIQVCRIWLWAARDLRRK